MDYRIEICGQAVRLRYTVNSMCAVEDLAGGTLDDVLDRKFTATRLLLWGGMIDQRPETTLAEVGELISRHLAGGGTLDEVVAWCAEGLQRAGFFGPAA